MRTRLVLLFMVSMVLSTTLIVLNVTLARVSASPDLESMRQDADPPDDATGIDIADGFDDLEQSIISETFEALPLIVSPPLAVDEIPIFPEITPEPETLIDLIPPVTLPPPTYLPGDLSPVAVDREPSWFSEEADDSSSIAWGDVDLDGDLDLAVGNARSDQGIGVAVYLSDGGRLPARASWETQAITGVMDIAWGDMDGDGDLDLAVARQDFPQAGDSAPSGGAASAATFRNDGLAKSGDLDMAKNWESAPIVGTSVAWGDVDGDADLDLAVGGKRTPEGGTVLVYLNSGKALSTTIAWEESLRSAVADVAWGDMDGDEDLDLAVGVDGYNRVLANQLMEEGRFALMAAWQSDDDWPTSSVAWADVDQDGDLDLAAGNSITPSETVLGPNAVIYENSGSWLDAIPAWHSSFSAFTTGIDWGDVDNDGDLDLLIANDVTKGSSLPSEIYLNQLMDGIGSPWTEYGGVLEPFDNTTDVYVFEEDIPEAFISDAGSPNTDNFIGPDDTGFLALYRGWESAASANSTDVRFADVDNDGDLDVLVANGDHNLLYENQTGTIAPLATSFIPEETLPGKVILGDYDRDGDLDMAVSLPSGGGAVVYRNDGMGFADLDIDGFEGDSYDFVAYPGFTESWRVQYDETYSVTTDIAWGDVDGDGDLDLAVANGRPSPGEPGFVDRIYSNDGSDVNGNLFMSPCWESPHPDASTSVAWGDVDGDGDLDVAFGVVDGPSKLYLNLGGALADEPVWQSEPGAIEHLAWGDVDGDGDLDLAAAVPAGPNRLYINDRGTLDAYPSWQSADRDRTTAVVWGDVDNDGDLDLAASNPGIPAKLYRNDGGQLTTTAVWQSRDVGETSSPEWADVNGDGYLDLVMADITSGIRIYINRFGELETRASNRSRSPYVTSAIATGDVNGDGFHDIASVNYDESSRGTDIYFGRRPMQQVFGGTPTLSISPANSPANHYALSAIQADGTLSLEYSWTNPNGAVPREVRMTYANGAPSPEDGRWLLAKPAEPISLSTILTDGSANPFVWDVYGSGFFGRSDNVTLRMEAYPSYLPQAHGTAGPYQIAGVSAETFPMRVRGNQIRVTDEDGKPVEGASVYRLERTQTVANPIGPEGLSIGYTTDSEGYLQGFGILNPSDNLVAVWPADVITTPFDATVYHLSAPTNEDGLVFTSARGSGVQTLTVSAENPLVLFDLDLSLAWDARNDGEFLQKLETGIEQASAVLYDVTDGQVALGVVRVYQEKEIWPDAHIVLYAANNIHPRATMGGIVKDWVADTMVDGRTIADAYVPGQIRMGPLWDPFNQSQSELSVDWWRALAHELSHYLLFLPDNYLGLDGDKLKITNCVGSLMTNAYDDKRYDEFLTEPDWKGDCLETVASQKLTGRNDWQTITTFFDMLEAPDAEAGTANSGPESLPLGVTRVCFVEPGDDGWGDCLPLGQGVDRSKVFTARPYDIRDERNNLTQVKQGQSFLYKTELEIFGTGDSERRVVDIIPLGSTGSGRDVIMVRGAERYDQVCLFDGQHDPPRVGCEVVTGSSPSVQIFEVEGWRPEIVVSPIIVYAPVVSATASITAGSAITGGLPLGDTEVSATEVSASRLAVTVTLPISVASGRLMAQVIPAYADEYALEIIESDSGPNTRRPLERTVLELAQEGDSEGKPWIYAGSVEPRFLAAEGFVRVWEPGKPTHEAVSQYFVSEGWDARNRGTSPTNKLDSEARNRGTSPTNRRDVEARNRGTSPTNRRDAEARNRGTSPTNRRDSEARNRGTSPTNRRDSEARNRGTSPTNRRDSEARNRGTSPTNRRAWGGNRRTLEAPVASGDGRVTIFNLADIFAPTGLTSLQALSNIPSLPAWFTSVGKVYRFDSTEEFPGTIAFHYLQREVPEGHEDALRIFYRPDDNIDTAWQALVTDVDTRENLASARMPEPAKGTYALIATVELPALQGGWNMIAYTLPNTRTVESALASLDGRYSVLYSYLPGVESSWQSFDPEASSLYGELADLVNDLDELSFGHSYLIYATEVVTPYLAITDAPPARYLPAADSPIEGVIAPLSIPGGHDSVDGLLVAPARFFGPITGTMPIAAGDVMTVTARVDGETNCGVGQASLLDGHWVYSLAVASEAETSGCGRIGRSVEILIEDEVSGRHIWRNDVANYLPLKIEE